MTELKMTLCLSNDSILISEDILEQLGKPRQIQMLFSDTKKQLMLRACSDVDRDALVVPLEFSGPFAMSGRVILKRIKKITGWDDDLPRLIFGEYNKTMNIMLFDLAKAIKADKTIPLVEMKQ